MAPLRPVARDHEQRVVDRDRETDQDDELAGVRAHRSHGLAVQTQDPERGEERRDRHDERHDRGDDRAEGDEQDEERQRDRQPQRRVQPAVDELLDVLVGERPVERVDPQIRVCVPQLVHERAQRREPGFERFALAGNVRGDANRRAVGRHEARLGWRETGIDDVGEQGLAGAVDLGRRRRHAGQDVVQGRVGERAVRGADDDERPVDRIFGRRAGRVEHVVGARRFERRLVLAVVVDGVGGQRSTGSRGSRRRGRS